MADPLADLRFTTPIDWREPATTALWSLRETYPEVAALEDVGLDKTAAMYANVPIEEGGAALGQALSHLGFALYQVNTGGDESVFLMLRADGTHPAGSLEVVWEGASTSAELLAQEGKKWGQKARQIRAPKLDLVADHWSEDTGATITWLNGDWCLWTDDSEAFVADVGKWDLSPTGVDHMIVARFAPRSEDGDFDLRFSGLEMAVAADSKTLWAVQVFARPHDPQGAHKSGLRDHCSVQLHDRDELLGRYSLPAVFPPENLPLADGAGPPTLPERTLAAEYSVRRLVALPNGFWRLEVSVTNRRHKDPKLSLGIALVLDATFAPVCWLPAEAGHPYAEPIGGNELRLNGDDAGPTPDDAESAPQNRPGSSLLLDSIPCLPTSSKGWLLAGSEVFENGNKVFELAATDLQTGARYRRSLKGMQPKLDQCRYGQHIRPVRLPEDWLLLDIEGDDWGLKESAWLWHLPTDRFFAIPLGAVSPHRENVDYHYHAGLDCLFAVNCSYNRSTALFRLIPRREMLARLTAEKSLLRNVPGWETLAETEA
ncbi:MAG: hypothetical protein WBP72_11610 [Rhodocyclaceae bacterium]